MIVSKNKSELVSAIKNEIVSKNKWEIVSKNKSARGESWTALGDDCNWELFLDKKYRTEGGTFWYLETGNWTGTGVNWEVKMGQWSWGGLSLGPKLGTIGK